MEKNKSQIIVSSWEWLSKALQTVIFIFFSVLCLYSYSPLSLPSSSSSFTPNLSPPFPPNMAAEELPVEHLNLILCALGRKLASLHWKALTSDLEWPKAALSCHGLRGIRHDRYAHCWEDIQQCYSVCQDIYYCQHILPLMQNQCVLQDHGLVGHALGIKGLPWPAIRSQCLVCSLHWGLKGLLIWSHDSCLANEFALHVELVLLSFLLFGVCLVFITESDAPSRDKVPKTQTSSLPSIYSLDKGQAILYPIC